MSRWVTGILAVVFSWTQCAQAFPKQEMLRAKHLVEKTQWSKKPLKLAEFYRVTKDTFPLELQFEIESVLMRAPDLELPPIEMRMIRNGNHEDMQILAQNGGQSVSGVFSLRGENIGTLTFSAGGKNLQKKLGYRELFDPARMLDDVPGRIPSYVTQIGFTRLLHGKELALLREQDRLRYGEQVRDILHLAEKAQGKLNQKRLPSGKKTGKKTSFHPLLQKMLESASAEVAVKSCLTLGWIGSLQNGKCVPPMEAKDTKVCSSGLVCPPLFYGPQVCSQTLFEEGQLSSAIEPCNTRSESSKYDIFKGVKTQKDFDKKMDGLSKEINKIRLLCRESQDNSTKKECEDLEVRMKDLMAVSCDVLKKWKSEYTDLKCVSSDAPPTSGAPASSGTVAPSGAAAPKPKPSPTAGATPRPHPRPNGASRPTVPTEPLLGEGTDGQPPLDEDGDIAPALSAAAPHGSGDDLSAQPSGHGTSGNQTASTGTTGPMDGSSHAEAKCVGLPLNPSSLNCQGGQVASMTCPSNGERRVFYYCECGGSQEVRTNTVMPTGCVGSRSSSGGSSDYVPGAGRYVPKYVKTAPSGGFGIGGMPLGSIGDLLPLLFGGFMIYMQNQNMKQQYAAYANMWAPTPVRVAPPATYTGPIYSPYGVNTGTNIYQGTR